MSKQYDQIVNLYGYLPQKEVKIEGPTNALMAATTDESVASKIGVINADNDSTQQLLNAYKTAFAPKVGVKVPIYEQNYTYGADVDNFRKRRKLLKVKLAQLKHDFYECMASSRKSDRKKKNSLKNFMNKANNNIVNKIIMLIKSSEIMMLEMEESDIEVGNEIEIEYESDSENEVNIEI